MTTYICKCGRTFQKNTEAGTTGFRMPDYGPGHECYGCPFVCEIKTWDPVTQQSAVQNHECRGSKTIQYDTQAALSRGDKCVGRIYSLDLEFLHRVRDFADTLDGIEPDRYAFSDRPSDYGDDGRFKLTIYPAQSNKGIAAKQLLFERFFNPDGSRMNVAPEQEKEIVLNQIKEAKALAQGKSTTAEVGTVYYHHNLVYFADQRENSKQFTVFMDDADHPCPSTRTEVATVPDFDTFDEAQNALDGLALKRGFSTERSAPEKAPEMEQPDDEQEDLGPDGMEELAEHQELTQTDPGEAPESGNDEADSGDGVGETPDSGDDAGDSANDGAEQPPCDWKNASGADEDAPEDDGENPENKIPAGERVSLRDTAFSGLLDACDLKINAALRVAVETKQGFTFQAKVTFDYRGGAFAIKHETGYQFDPIKVKDKSELAEEIQIVLDEDGNPVIPYDREHQLSFDELQPGREIPPTGTATVDGKTGIVESYQEDGTTGQTLDGPDEPAEDEEQPSYLCKNIDCPYCAAISDKQKCTFDPDDPNCTEDPDFEHDVADAVQFYRCTRPEVIQAFAEVHPDEDTDFEGDPDTQEDQPPYPDGEEINQEDDAS